jgi:hypothetical protein
LRFLTAVTCLGEISCIEGIETQRSSLSDLFEERLGRLLDVILFDKLR